MARIKVRCSYLLEIDVPDDPEYDAVFDIEENHCPGTGIVGAAFEKVRAECDAKRICWACRLQGENKIIVNKVG